MQLLASSRVIHNDHTLTEIECCFRQANLTCDCASMCTSMCDVITFGHVIVLSFACTSRQMCHSFRGKDWTRESEWLEKSRTNQFVKVVCHCHVNVDCVSEQPGDNVLGSQAWRISRTSQIVTHWGNSWVPVASLIDRRIRACVPVCLRIWHALVLQCSRISCVANF